MERLLLIKNNGMCDGKTKFIFSNEKKNVFLTLGCFELFYLDISISKVRIIR